MPLRTKQRPPWLRLPPRLVRSPANIFCNRLNLCEYEEDFGRPPFLKTNFLLVASSFFLLASTSQKKMLDEKRFTPPNIEARPSARERSTGHGAGATD